MIKLKRTKHLDGGTRGELFLPGGTTVHTIELPWRGNSSGTLGGEGSCIPTGKYRLTTDMYYNGGYEAPLIEGVEGRSQIQIHIANSAADVVGCVGVGDGTGRYCPDDAPDRLCPLPAVWNSSDTFTEVLMPALKPHLPTEIEVVNEG